MTGRVARIDRKGLEAFDVGALARHDVRCQAVRRRLHGDGEQHECSDPPVPRDHGHDQDNSDHRRNHMAAGERRANPGRIFDSAGALRDEPGDEPLVSPVDAVDGEDDSGDEEPEDDGERRKRGEARKKHDEEGGDRMPVAERCREPVCAALRLRVQERVGAMAPPRRGTGVSAGRGTGVSAAAASSEDISVFTP